MSMSKEHNLRDAAQMGGPHPVSTLETHGGLMDSGSRIALQKLLCKLALYNVILTIIRKLTIAPWSLYIFVKILENSLTVSLMLAQIFF